MICPIGKPQRATSTLFYSARVEATSQSGLETFPWTIVSIVVAVVFGVIGVTTSVIVFRKSRKRKTLDYAFIDDVKILSERATAMQSEIVVTVDGVDVNDPRIITVRYVNTGNQEILQSDFTASSITTLEDSGVVNSQLVGLSDNSISITEGGLLPHRRWTPDCLNPGDYLDVQYILDMAKADKAFTPVCRVQGATRPPELLRPRSNYYDDLASGLVEVMTGVLASFPLPTPISRPLLRRLQKVRERSGPL